MFFKNISSKLFVSKYCKVYPFCQVEVSVMSRILNSLKKLLDIKKYYKNRREIVSGCININYQRQGSNQQKRT